MSRPLKLTWQAGRDGRSGRWRKKYQGKVYYFSGGRGKSDREAYDAAVKEWELLKLKADAEAPRRHQAEYEAEIKVWDQVYTWSQRHADTSMAQVAFEKRDKLRTQLEAPILKPLSADDRFGAVFEPATVALPDDLLNQTANSLATGEVTTIHHEPLTSETARRYAQELDGSTFRLQKAAWDDRLASQQTRTAVRSNLVDEHIKSFVEQKKQEAERGDLSLGRFNVIRQHLDQFGKWIGVDATISEIDGPMLRRYQTHLLDRVKQHSQRKPSPRGQTKPVRFSATTAKEHLATVKTFVRWLWEMEVIAVLPRVLGNKSNTLKITAESTAPVIFDNAEVELLLKNATGRTKLFILLMLNCGMTQKDIADLRKSEVDLKAGRIIRKRSKTENFDSVPTVNYLLWPDTVALLKQFQNTGDDPLALVNANGSALWAEQLDLEGKYGKSDNIRNAFSRLTSKVGLTKPLKSLKKTSSSKLRDNERFNGLEDLFLGHAPQKMSDKHYTAAPQKLLDSAIRWLASEYGLASPG
jgi:integrase